MTGSEIRNKYLEFFTQRKHRQIPPAPIVPLEDSTTLFTGSGMQQLVPYLKGRPHPMGGRLVDTQACFRAEDIEEVGDNRHTTFFEMLGNWSLGDYFKKEQLLWFFEFLTKVVNLDENKLYVSVFAGNKSIPKDTDSIKIWQKLFNTKALDKPGKRGIDPKIKIYSYDANKNWWSRADIPEKMPPGEIGGPDSEVFYDFGKELKIHENSEYKNNLCHLNCDCGRFLEIGNSVFMEYEKQNDGSFKKLPKQNVDFGGGLERLTAASQNSPDVFTTDLFKPIISKIEIATGIEFKGENKYPMRIISDHLRGATLMLAQGIEPANKLQGYFVRRLLRRAIIKLRKLKVDNAGPVLTQAVDDILGMFDSIYFSKLEVGNKVKQVIDLEVRKFSDSLERGLKEIERHNLKSIDAKFAFNLYQSYGFPFELTSELLLEKGIRLNRQQFEAEFIKHKKLSRVGMVGIFKGGLADQSAATTKLHTATHLLNQALRMVLGTHVRQAGSNITAQRLRFDFKHHNPLTDIEIKKIENLVNQKIKENLRVYKTIESKNAAVRSGALAFFKETYPEKVTVYTIGKDPKKDWFSKELCAGPHVETTGQIGAIKVTKEQSVGSGIRRIYAELVSD